MKKIFCCLGLILSGQYSFSQPGSPDAAFGVGGVVITDFNGSYDWGYSLAIQSDGKIVVAGTTFDSTGHKFALARYNDNGSLDNSFGSSGKTTTGIATSACYARATLIQPDGKIVVAGQTNVAIGDDDFALVRYNGDGTPDSTFGVGGKATISFSNGMDQGNALAIQPDGRILVGGAANTSNFSSFFAIARLNTNGDPDSTFGTNGKVITGIGAAAAVFSLAVQNDGKIIAAGGMAGSLSFSSQNFALARYNSDGIIDSSFGTNGILIPYLSIVEDWGYAAAIQSDGKIIVGGHSAFDFALARFNTSGTADSTFGLNGSVITPMGPGNDYIYSVALQSDGKIVAAGYSQSSPGNEDVALARYNTDGSLDSTFGISGMVITSIGNSPDYAYSVAVQPDGKIVAAGYSDNGSGSDFAVMRYNNNAVGINEFSGAIHQLKIYPNPARHDFVIDLNGEKINAFLQISNIYGENVYSEEVINKVSVTVGQNLSKGIYFITLNDGRQLLSQKLIVQ